MTKPSEIVLEAIEEKIKELQSSEVEWENEGKIDKLKELKELFS